MSRRCTVEISSGDSPLSYIYCEINHAPIINQLAAPVSWTGNVPGSPTGSGAPCELEIIAIGVVGASYRVDITVDGVRMAQSQLRMLVRGGRDIYRTIL
jgi:hypothetical protein